MNMNENIFIHFPKIEKEVLLDIIQKELKGVSIDSLAYKYHEKISMTPFIFSEYKKSISKPIIWKKNRYCNFGLSYLQLEDDLSIDKLIEALDLGIEQIKLTRTNYNLEKSSFLSKKYPNVQWIFKDENLRHFENAENIIIESKQNDPIEQLKEMLIHAWNILKIGEKKSLNQQNILKSIHFTREINPNYLFEIALGRAHRILWRNILTILNIENPNPPNFDAMLTIKDVNPLENNLISSTTQIMSAILGGNDQVYLEFEKKSKNPYFHNYIHIFNILHLESALNEVVDPLAGCNHIEILTEKISNTVWSELKS